MIQDYLKDKWRQLHEIRAEPEAVAGGVAIGTFMGFTPFVGFKTVIALLAAWLTRCSKLAAVIAVTLHDVLLPVAPVFIWVEYKLGNFILRTPHPPKIKGHSAIELPHNWTTLYDWRSLFDWHFFWTYAYPVLIGSIAIALPVSVLSYYITHYVLVKMRERRRIEAEKEASKVAGKSPESGSGEA